MKDDAFAKWWTVHYADAFGSTTDQVRAVAEHAWLSCRTRMSDEEHEHIKALRKSIRKTLQSKYDPRLPPKQTD